MRFIFTLVTLLALGCLSIAAAELTGKVVDTNGKPIPSVSIVTNVGSIGTVSAADGSFIMDDRPEIAWVTFSSVGYKTRQFEINDLPEIVVLESIYYRGDDIIVTANRARRGISPIAFSNLSADEIERDYTIGEFPLLLATTPNVFTYTDGGAPLGYSYIMIRGFDDKRITTYINGVPLNDPEWQATYFVDMPDFASNIEDIQVQRGIGNSLYGDASFGGTINIVTSALAQQRQATFTAGYGTFRSGGKSIGNIHKQSLEYSTGLLNGHWNFSGRYSNQRTDGYREFSWYRGQSYYLSLARTDANMTTELYIYGGPIKMHLAFWGASRDAINANRRFNPRTYANETDNFNQPHFQLHNTARLSDDITLQNTLYYIRGKGYYEQLAEGSVLDDYAIDPAIIAIDPGTGLPFTSADLVRQDHVTKNQYGWNPRLTVEHDRGRHTIGGSVYYFESDHTGVVTQSEHLNGKLDTNHEFYQWNGEQWVGSFYVEEQYEITDMLSLQTATQLRYQRFTLNEQAMGNFLGHRFDMDWLFVSPRLGLNYRLSEHINLYTNAAMSSRPPIVATIYDGTVPNILPLLKVASVNNDSTLFTFGEPLISSERLYTFELGGNYRTERVALGANVFWMEFRNEIIPYGPVNPFTGLRTAVNVDRTLHAGVELSALGKVNSKITLDGNISYNYNRVKDFVIDLDGFEVDFADKTISGFPDYVGSMVADFKSNGWRVTHRLNIAGRRYLELLNVESLSLDPYVIASLSVAYSFENFMRLGKLTLVGRVDNWTDKKYESLGYGGNYAYDDGSGKGVVDGWAEYYVAPERSFYTQLRLEMF